MAGGPDTVLIESMHFDEGGVQIVYVDGRDMREVAGAPVTMTRTFVVPRYHENYRDEIQSIWDDIVDLVRDIAQDHSGAQPWEPPGLVYDDDEDEDEGMGQ